MVLKLVQAENMPKTSVTLLMSNVETSIDVRLWQPVNMQFMDVTSEVLRFSMPTMLVKLPIKSNHLCKVTGLTSLKLPSNLIVVALEAVGYHATEEEDEL